MRIGGLTLLLVVLAAILTPYLTSASEPELVDCSNLLILLDKSLRAVEEGEPSAYQMIQSIGSASIPGDVGNLHKNSYDLLLRYYNLSARAIGETLTREEARRMLSELSELYSKLPDVISQYVNRLAACAHDPGLSNSLRTSISLSVKRISDELIPSLTQIVFSKYLTSNGLIDVRLGKEVYASGELVEFEVILGGPALTLSSASLYTWPDLRFVEYANITSLGEGRYAGFLRTPSAEFVKTPTRSEGVFMLIITARNASSGESYVNYEILKVVYRVPKVWVECPATIYRGDSIELDLYSDNYYNATVEFGDVLVGYLSLAPGLTRYYVNTSTLNLSVGVSLLKVSVRPTQDSAGLTITKPVMVLPRIPKARIVFPEIFFTGDGFLTILLINEDSEESQLSVKVYVGGALRGEYTLSDVLVARVFVGFFPAFLTNLNVVVESTQHLKEPYLYQRQIFVVNPVTTLLMGLASIFLIVLISSKERSFMIFIKGNVVGGKTSVRRVVREVSSYLTSPYLISSRIAELYYATLRKLGIPLPKVTETLREHFSRAGLSGFLRDTLWKLLIITEKDLYSSKKQDYRKAVELAEEVTRREGE
jgi:hypothetical protein